MSIWDKVDEMVQQGKAPVVRLNPSAAIDKPRLPRGRVRLKYSGRKGHAIMHTPAGKPMLCRKPGCYKAVRVNVAEICCSKECANSLREECEFYLGILEGKIHPTELPPHMRTRRRVVKRNL